MEPSSPVPFRGSRCIHIHRVLHAEGKFTWTCIFRCLPFSQQFPGKQKDAKIWHQLWITKDIVSLVGSYDPFSSASSFFLFCTHFTIFCRVSNFWLIFQHFFYFCSSSFFQAFTCPSVPPLTLLLLCISLPSSPFCVGSRLPSTLSSLSGCRKH